MIHLLLLVALSYALGFVAGVFLGILWVIVSGVLRAAVRWIFL